MMIRIIFLLVAFLMFNRTTQAQGSSTSGLLIFTLGSDTTMIGNFSLDGRKFSLNVLSKENATVYELNGALFENGELQSVDGISYKVEYAREPSVKKTYKFFMKGDSSHTEIKTETGSQHYIYYGRGIVNNMIGYATFFLFPFWPEFSPLPGDSLVSQHLWWNKPKKYTIRRIGSLKMEAESTIMGRLILNLDTRGKLNTINAVGSSLNLIGHIAPYREMDSIISAFKLREYSFGKTGPNNKLDSVAATMGSLNIKIQYSRPSVRGRIIFGEVVPYNRFWRTGANRATLMKVDKPIHFGEQILPAGEYSIFTLPGEKSWTVMLNREVGIWGTEYNPLEDILRVEMKVEDVDQIMELMTIDIKPINNSAGLIQIGWERKRASVVFTL
jgi:hypothetical protein